MKKENSTQITALLERIGRLISIDGYTMSMKPVQWEALRYLAKANRFSNTPASLTAYLGLTKGTVSQTILALQNKGFIDKQTDDIDRRSIRLFLTPKGKRLLKSDPLSEIENAINQLSASTRVQLESNLQTVLASCLESRNQKPFGQCRNCKYFAKNHKKGNPHRCRLIEVTLTEIDAEKICYEQSPRVAV